jgi:hypothetical protein
MSQMFENASAFNQDISAWTINTSISPNPPTDFANGSAITNPDYLPNPTWFSVAS